VVLLIFLFIYLSRVLPTGLLPRARQQNTFQVATQDENDIRFPITLLSVLTASFLSPFVYSIALVLRSRTTLTDAKIRRRVVAVRSLFPLVFSFPFMRLYLSHSFPITRTPEVAATIQNLD
jgi:hypothetical protein